MELKSTEDEDIMLWHRMFYNNVCSQIAAKESEIAKYNSLKTQVVSLKSDLESFALNLYNTYLYASSGISCIDLDASIEKIVEYSVKAKQSIVSLDGVIQNIDATIDKLHNEIEELKASIGI